MHTSEYERERELCQCFILSHLTLPLSLSLFFSVFTSLYLQPCPDPTALLHLVTERSPLSFAVAPGAAAAVFRSYW